MRQTATYSNQPSTKLYLQFFVLTALVIFLVGCSDESTQDSATTIPTLNDSNINSFTEKLTADYLDMSDRLLHAFKQAKKSGNANFFIEYRNNTWTPAYIPQKDYYTEVFKKNKAFLAKVDAGALFARYENLIYVGLDLKNGLLNQDQDRIQLALAEAAKDKALVSKIQTLSRTTTAMPIQHITN